jgi:hypothetical protein
MTGGAARTIGRIIDGMAYCERCDMDRAYCEHGLAEKRQAAITAPVKLLISPSGMAHFPGCPHKGDDPDYDRWAELETPGSWARLGNGEHIRATGGNRPDLVAAARCRDCVQHGPW